MTDNLVGKYNSVFIGQADFSTFSKKLIIIIGFHKLSMLLSSVHKTVARKRHIVTIENHVTIIKNHEAEFLPRHLVEKFNCDRTRCQCNHSQGKVLHDLFDNNNHGTQQQIDHSKKAAKYPRLSPRIFDYFPKIAIFEYFLR